MDLVTKVKVRPRLRPVLKIDNTQRRPLHYLPWAHLRHTGLQPFPNWEHSKGFLIPFIIWPEIQFGFSGASATLMGYFLVASKAAYFSFTAKPLWGIFPIPRHNWSLISNTSCIVFWASGLPFSLTMRAYWFSTLASLFSNCRST